MELTEALEGARRGDEWAIAALFRTLQPSLLRYLRHHAPDVAEDLASECWLALSKVLPSFEGGAGDLRAWLFGVARNQVANHYRARGRQPASWAEPEPSGIALDPADAVLEAISSQAAVDALVAALPPDQAEIVLLRVVAGLRVEEVAAILEKSPGAVRVAQHRALRRLAVRWGKKAVTR